MEQINQKIHKNLDLFIKNIGFWAKINQLRIFWEDKIYPLLMQFVWWKIDVLMNGSIISVPMFALFSFQITYWNIMSFGIILWLYEHVFESTVKIIKGKGE